MNEIFSDIVTEIGLKIQKTDTTYKTFIKNAFNAYYEMVCRKYAWKDLYVFDEALTLSAGVEFLYLPKTVQEILALTDRANSILLVPSNVQILMRNHLDTISDQASPYRYTPAGTYGAKAQPATTNTIQVLSNDADDITTKKVRIWGKAANGEILSELLTLTGATPVDSSNTYSELIRVAKNLVTDGTITVREKTTNTTLATIAPWEFVPRYKKIRLQPVPLASATVYLTYKKVFQRLVNDEDIVEIPCLPALKDLTMSDCLEEQRQYEKAKEKKADGWAKIQIIAEEQSQGDDLEQSQPEVQNVDIDEQITE